MPQGLSAGPQRPTRPGLAGGQQIGDWPRASAPTNAGSRKRPVHGAPFSQPGTAPLEPQEHREQLVAAEPGPPRSQRHPERTGRLQQDRSTTPKPAILRDPANRRTAPSGTPYSAGICELA